MATSVLMGGNTSDHHLEKMSTIRSREMEMTSLCMTGSGDHDEKRAITRISSGKLASRRKKSSKLQGELGQKKKIPQRGLGVEQLERIRVGLVPERVVKKMTHHHHENYNINPPSHSPLISQQPQFPPAGAFGGAFMGSSLMTNGSSGSIGHGGQQHQAPAALLQQFQGFKYSGINDGRFHGHHHHHHHVINTSSGGGTVGALFSDETFLSHHDHPFAAVGVGSRIRAGNSTEASRELSSIPNNMKWYSEECGFCQKKKFRGNGETIMCNINGEKKMSCGSEMMPPVMNGFGSFAHARNKGHIFNGGNNLNYFASQTTPPSQEVEVKAVLHSASKGNSSTTNAGGGGSSSHVVMEYELFPGKFGGSTTTSTSSGFIKQKQEVVISLKTEAAASSSVHHEQQATAMVLGEASSSSYTAAAAVATTISSSICSDHQHQNSNSIDLSLKLSSYC